MSYVHPLDFEPPAVLPRPVIDGVKRPRFVLRTIHDGAVTIYGRQYRPDEQHRKYDGRLDGLRMAFGLYNARPDLICLWGTERAYRAVGEEEDTDWPGPACVDGRFPWMFWSTNPRTVASREEEPS